MWSFFYARGSQIDQVIAELEVIGVHAGHTQAHFMRAIIEGINYALYRVAASVQESIGAIQNIYASGRFSCNNSLLAPSCIAIYYFDNGKFIHDSNSK